MTQTRRRPLARTSGTARKRADGTIRRMPGALSLALGLALVLAALFPDPGAAKLAGFESERIAAGRFLVRYTSLSVTGEYDNMMVYLLGNAGQLCLDQGFRYARLESVLLGSSDRGAPRVSTTVELFADAAEGARPCEELASLPKDRKELKRSPGEYELPPHHSLALEEKEDPIEGMRTLDSSGNRLERGVDGAPARPPHLELNPYAVAKDGSVLRGFRVRYHGESWMFIRDGESLVIRAGDEVLRLTRHAYNSKVLDDASVVEVAGYLLSAEELDRIRRADEVLVRLDGKNFDLDRSLGDLDRRNLAHFAERCHALAAASGGS